MKYILLIPIQFYKWFISPLLGSNCRYTPSCSTYMKQAIEMHGSGKGLVLGTKRFCKCHPFAKTHFEETKGYDPVPLKEIKTNEK
jgi:putative membrane protein insertion efficiency factor